MRPQEDRLWYRQSARNWNEALPIGNGRMGAMIFGGAKDEKIQLNEDTLWTGMPGRFSNENAVEYFRRARDYTMAGDYEKAQEIIEQDFLGKVLWSQIYQPLGDLTLHMEHGDESRYSRSLNLCTATHHVMYMADDVLYEREMFMSCPDQCMVTGIRCNKKEALNFSLHLTGAMKSTLLTDGKDLVLTGNCPSAVYQFKDRGREKQTFEYGDKDENKGIGYAARVRVTSDGQVEVKKDKITVKNGSRAVLILCVRTSFNQWNKHPVLQGKEYLARCLQDLDEACEKNYEELKENHLNDYMPLYSQIELDLGGMEAGLLPTDERLLRHENGLEDNALYTLYFNFGRYLTLAASREGSQAMNLQGIWNHEIRPSWNSNYTLNINTEMNYWPTLRCGLSNCMEPLLRLIDELAESGKWTAREYYGASGSVAHHNTDLWRMSTPVGAGCKGTTVFSLWPMGLIWLSRSVWEYFEYTDDTEYLRKRGYPVLHLCAEFVMDMLISDDEGYLVMAPATSPENTFTTREDKVFSALSRDSAMNNGLIHDLFSHCLKAEAALGEVEDPLEKRIQFILPKLRPVHLDDEGRIREWYENIDENERQHRHLSPLYGLYPGFRFTEKTPELLEGCRKTMKSRGDDGTGWSLGWKINVWARLHEGNKALQILDRQLMPVYAKDGVNYRNGGGTYFNLFDAHPPFQIDGNFGAAAGIMEMLCQCDEEGKMTLLPALPRKWKNGSVKGLKLPHGKTLDMVWENGEVVSVQVQ